MNAVRPPSGRPQRAGDTWARVESAVNPYIRKSYTREHVRKSSLFVSPTKLANTIGYIILCCNRFTILFTQIIHKTHTKIKKICLISQDSILKSTVVQHNS